MQPLDGESWIPDALDLIQSFLRTYGVPGVIISIILTIAVLVGWINLTRSLVRLVAGSWASHGKSASSTRDQKSWSKPPDQPRMNPVVDSILIGSGFAVTGVGLESPLMIPRTLLSTDAANHLAGSLTVGAYLDAWWANLTRPGGVLMASVIVGVIMGLASLVLSEERISLELPFFVWGFLMGIQLLIAGLMMASVSHGTGAGFFEGWPLVIPNALMFVGTGIAAIGLQDSTSFYVMDD